MDERLEDELLLHVAAGTEIPRAFTALPRDEPAAGPTQGAWTLWAVLIGVVVAFLVAGRLN